MMNWLWVILKGIGFGITLSFLIGPAFFTLIQTSLKKGFPYGMAMAVGIALSDSIYIAICYLGVSRWAENEYFNTWFGLIGGFIMLIFGFLSIFKRVENLVTNAERKEINKITGRRGLLSQMLKGFLLNIVNPFLLVFWLGVVGPIANDASFTKEQVLVCLGMIVFSVFCMDTLKSHLAGRLSNIITPRVMQVVNRVVGLALIVYSFRLLHVVYVHREIFYQYF
ncbi:MAG: LysE family translocator [Cytophagales bacterium]|nr:LysE family translocator [Cytophagales bacterium]